MPFPLSPQSIDAIAFIISGGAANADAAPVGLYRSGPKIEKFMHACNVAFTLDGSRVPSLVNCLIRLNNGHEAATVLPRIIEAAADPRDFVHDPDRHSAVCDYLNRALRFDGFELQNHGVRMRLLEAGKGVPVLTELAGLSEVIDFDTVSRDLDRALESSQTDPEDAVTAACSTIESVCRSILIDLGEPLPKKKDVQGLYNAVKQPLGLSTDRSDIDPTIANDVLQILSGLANVVRGVGALRTHGGDAHGREKGYARIDARIARLAIHAASTAALFLIETWQRKFPDRPLPKATETSQDTD
ncbi:MAG: abortive infection family protein [Neomegalonema sp.]|nr:abortive infection family protein [Neomegalonema sp.]